MQNSYQKSDSYELFRSMRVHKNETDHISVYNYETKINEQMTKRKHIIGEYKG